MINEQIKNIKFKYRNIKDKENVFKDFYLPCLKYSKEYYRSVGFWNSSSLISWAESLPTIIKDYKERKIKLLISKNLESSDMVKILELQHNEEEIKKYLRIKTEDIIKEAIEFTHNPIDNTKKMNIFSWLFTHKILEIKIAIPRHVKNADDYHDKFGIFVFSDDNKISFTGSMNESYTSHVRKSETIRVFKSWDNEEERKKIEEELNDFKEDWHGNDNLEVFELSEDTKHKIKERTPEKDPFEDSTFEDFKNNSENFEIYDESKDPYLNPSKRYDFQNEYRDKFIKAKNGILELATGTGKTKTALSIVSELLNKKLINKIIIQMYGAPLLEQWYNEEISIWRKSRKQKEILRTLRQTHKFNPNKIECSVGLNKFVENFDNKEIVDLLLIRESNLEELLNKLKEKDLSKTIIIHDEVHGLFSTDLAPKIKGLHKGFEYKLGLSATAEDEYDKERNKLLFSEIGNIIEPKFGPDKAIERGILSEMELIILNYQLERDESKQIADQFAKRNSKIKNGDWSKEEEKNYRIMVSQVRKKAKNKIPVFIKYLNKDPLILDRTIIFVNNYKYGDKLYKELLNFTPDIRKYYDDKKDVDNIKMFTDGEINTIISCISLSQGISINSLNNIVVFSPESMIKNIQRLGRVLRLDPENPNKKARVLDFIDADKVLEIDHADQKRYKWLKKLSNTKTNKEYAN